MNRFQFYYDSDLLGGEGAQVASEASAYGGARGSINGWRKGAQVTNELAVTTTGWQK